MILIDANVLLYAYDEQSPQQPKARAWLEQVMNTERDVRLGLATVLAFLRLATDPRVFMQPLAVVDATAIVASWLARDNVALAAPSEGHWSRLGAIATDAKARGALLMDAHLAVLAIEHGATVVTSDRDFTRFPAVRTADPLERA